MGEMERVGATCQGGLRCLVCALTGIGALYKEHTTNKSILPNQHLSFSPSPPTPAQIYSAASKAMGLFKIDTIGDAYEAAAWLSEDADSDGVLCFSLA